MASLLKFLAVFYARETLMLVLVLVVAISRWRQSAGAGTERKREKRGPISGGGVDGVQ